MEVQHDGRGNYECFVDYGRQQTGVNAIDWAQQAVELGAGEILLTSVNYEGTGEGFDVKLTAKIARSTSVPVIACGGAGNANDFYDVLVDGHADAVSAASVFHYKYAKPVASRWMQFDEPRLRLGEEIDSGNIDFLNEGYGGLKNYLVEPLTINEVKEHLAKKGLPMRFSSPTLTSFISE